MRLRVFKFYNSWLKFNQTVYNSNSIVVTDELQVINTLLISGNAHHASDFLIGEDLVYPPRLAEHGAKC